MSAISGVTLIDPGGVAELVGPLIKAEIASIGALEAAQPREENPEYVVLLRESKTSKQANVEQLNTLLRVAGRPQVVAGGLAEPILELQTIALQKASTTAMLMAMRLVEHHLVERYREAAGEAQGIAKVALEKAGARATKRWVVLVAHVAQRKDDDSIVVLALCDVR